jgi:hypothetical protein
VPCLCSGLDHPRPRWSASCPSPPAARAARRTTPGCRAASSAPWRCACRGCGAHRRCHARSGRGTTASNHRRRPARGTSREGGWRDLTTRCRGRCPGLSRPMCAWVVSQSWAPRPQHLRPLMSAADNPEAWHHSPHRLGCRAARRCWPASGRRHVPVSVSPPLRRRQRQHCRHHRERSAWVWVLPGC